MQIVSAPSTDSEVTVLNAAPSDVKIFILEHEGRRMYLVLDKEWARGGHAAVYNSPAELFEDDFGQ